MCVSQTLKAKHSISRHKRENFFLQREDHMPDLALGNVECGILRVPPSVNLQFRSLSLQVSCESEGYVKVDLFLTHHLCLPQGISQKAPWEHSGASLEMI